MGVLYLTVSIAGRPIMCLKTINLEIKTLNCTKLVCNFGCRRLCSDNHS